MNRVKLLHMWSYRHNNFTVHQLPALKDNYIYLIEMHNSETLIAVDPAEAVSISRFCKASGKQLTHIINTHHHWDHTDGNITLKEKFHALVIAAAGDGHRIPAIDTPISEHAQPEIDDLNITVLSLPGNTRGHIGYLIDDALFCGDVLFGAGCGRIFEGTHQQMWQSLCKLASLPSDTKLYCAHEYTLANLRFAQAVDPVNEMLSQRINDDTRTRMDKQPTIPSTISLELATNPFLRPLDKAFCNHYARQNNISDDALAVFSDLRTRKDNY